MNPAIRPWNRGDKFSAGHLNESVDVARALVHLTSGKGGVIQTPNGTALISDFNPNPVGWSDAITDETGTPYTDERYKFNFSYIDSGAKTTDQITLKKATVSDYDGNTGTVGIYPPTATNFAELNGHTHALPDKTPIQVFALYDCQLPPRLHWFFIRAVQPWFKLAANATGYGIYTAHPLRPTTGTLAVGSATALTEANLGTVDTGITVYLANMAEIGLTGHKLLFDATTYLPQHFPATYWKLSDDGTKPVFQFWGFQWKACP